MNYLNCFEKTAVDIAISIVIVYAVCSHTHYPNLIEYRLSEQSFTYVNSGDWLENLNILEYDKEKRSMYGQYKGLKVSGLYTKIDKPNKELFTEMPVEFKMMKNK